MKNKEVRSFVTVLLVLLGLIGCVSPSLSGNGEFRIETAEDGSMSFRRVTAEKTDEGLIVAGRVSSLRELPVSGNDVFVSLRDEAGNLIDQKTVSSFPRLTTGRAQSPESRFAVRFEEVPSGRLVIGVESGK